uniref:Replication-associated protein n=1 Tax=Cressdnaviricota sp. TaxID=2748378 RepID=A0A6M4B6B5_9VIRU|nr:replication-associated protein [Cressdnaviricota sp.]
MRYYSYVFTINRRDGEEESSVYDLFEDLKTKFGTLVSRRDVTFMCMETEKGEEERLHIQGYIHFRTLKSMNQVKEILVNHAHVEGAKSDDEKNLDYCSKDYKEAKPWARFIQLGKKSRGQGSRTDMDEFLEAVKDGMSIEDLYTNFGSIMVKNANGAFKAIEQLRPMEERTASECYCYYGSSGSGKTTDAMLGHNQGKCYFVTIANNSNIWFNGYLNAYHEVVIIDEFSDQIATIDRLKVLLDKFQNQVEIKGGFRFFNPPAIVITSQHSPMKWFRHQPSEQDMIALLRRFKSIVKYEGRYAEKNVKKIIIKQNLDDDPRAVMDMIIQLDSM